MNIHYKYFIVCILSLACSITGGLAQEGSTTVASDSIFLVPLGDYTHLKLPPLQMLLDNAKQNPQVRQNDANIKAAEYDLKIEKRKWLSYISARAGYSYGILGTYNNYESEYNPLTTTYSGSSQSSYNVGASISVPLNDILSRGLHNKQQKKVVEQAEFNREIVYNTLKAEIIETYANIQSHLAIMQRLAETLALCDANYNVVKNDFLNGKASPQDLSTVKNGQKDALQEYETMRALLTSMLLKLELYSNTQIIKK